MDIRANSIVRETQPDLLESICCQRIKNLYCLKKKKEKKKQGEYIHTCFDDIYIYLFLHEQRNRFLYRYCIGRCTLLPFSSSFSLSFSFFILLTSHSFAWAPVFFLSLFFVFDLQFVLVTSEPMFERAKNGRRSTNPSSLAVILTVIRCFVGDRLDDDNDNNDNDDHHQHHHQHHHHHHHHSPLVAHSRKYARRRDMLYNSFTGKFHCPNCNNGYGRRDTMLGHFRYECGKAPRYKCPYCTLCSKKTSNVYQHIRSMHPKELVTLVKLYWSVESMELFLTLHAPPPPSLSPFLSPFRRCRIPILMQIVRSIDRTYKRRTIVHSSKIVVSNE